MTYKHKYKHTRIKSFYLPLYDTAENIYFNGDIVEVLNLNQSQLNDIPSKSPRGTGNISAEIIGARYKVAVITHRQRTTAGGDFDQVYEDPTKWRIELKYNMLGWGHGGHYSRYMDSTQITLFRRPWKNYIKLLKLKIFGIYNP